MTKPISQTVNFTLFIAIILAAFIAISKEIFIFNDEALVVLCFIVFILLSYNSVSDALSNELEERSLKIQSEFDNLFSVEKELLKNVVSLNKKQQDLCKALWEMLAILILEKAEISNYRKNTLNQIIVSQTKQKLDTLLSYEINIINSLQYQISEEFSNNILENFKNKLNNNIKEQLILENIEIIKNISK